MALLRVPGLFRYYLDGQAEVPVQGETVALALQDVLSRYPKMGPHLFDQKGQLRRHIHVFVNTEHIRNLQGLASQLRETDVIKIVPAVTGG